MYIASQIIETIALVITLYSYPDQTLWKYAEWKSIR